MQKENVTSVISVFTIAINCLVLFGWHFDIALLKGAIWQLPVISPTETFIFILAGTSLLLLKSQPARGWQYIFGRACALTIIIVSGLVLAKYFIISPYLRDVDPFTSWITGTSLESVKISLYAVASMLLIGTGLFLLDFATRHGQYPAQWLILGAMLIEIFTITIFSYGIVPFEGIFHSEVKPHSGLIIILLGYGVLSARRHSGSIIALLEDGGPSGLMLRWLLPFIILGPMILGWLKVWGQNAGFFSPVFGDALIALAGSSLFVGLFWNVAKKLKLLDTEKKETEALLSNTLKTAPDSIIVCDEKHIILLVNKQTEKMFGYAPDELLGKAIEILIPEQLRDAHARHQQSYIQQPQIRSMGQGLNIMGRRKDGSLFPADIALSAQQYHGHLIFTAIVRDITERKQNEKALMRQQRALSMVSTGNRTLLHSVKGNEVELLQTMCQVIIEVGGFSMAWVGYRVDDNQKTVRPMAQSGSDQGYLERAAISWGKSKRGRGPVGLAIRTGQIQVANNFSTDPNFSPWREEALKRDYNSGIALPLKNKEEVFGVLMIYSDESDAFDELEISNLDEMAADLSFGIITLRNNLAHAKAESDLKASYSMLESTLESTADGIVVTSLTGDILKYNQQFADIWNFSERLIKLSNCDQLMSCVSNQLIDVGGFIERTHEIYTTSSELVQDEFELKNRRIIQRIARPYYMEGEIVGRVCSLRDITEQRKYESQLTYLANHDALTGLPNRNLLNDRINQAISYASRLEEQFALVFLDLDSFKLINDGLGHDFGDHVLIKIAKRIQACLRNEDTVARMGGDEFVILLPGVKHDEDVAAVARNLLDAIALPCSIDTRELLLEASLGIALFPRDGDDAGALLMHADAAMYGAKDNGGNSFKFYKDGIDAQVNRHLEIAWHLQNAIDQNEFQVIYQPQFDFKSEKIIGAEALLRWQHPTMGVISPAEFIPIAEKSRVILKIGEWVAETVIKQCKAWQSEGIPLLSVAINISARQLEQSDLPEILATLLNKYDLNPNSFTLELELTEGMLMKHPEHIIQILNELKAMNFNISIDDFGTGYSSLAYLKKFPIDKLKIDRSFIKDIPDDLEDVAISSAIIVMAHELGMTVVAEGVETEEQFALLKARGCDMVQGYLTGHPMTVLELEAVIKQSF